MEFPRLRTLSGSASRTGLLPFPIAHQRRVASCVANAASARFLSLRWTATVGCSRESSSTDSTPALLRAATALRARSRRCAQASKLVTTSAPALEPGGAACGCRARKGETPAAFGAGDSTARRNARRNPGDSRRPADTPVSMSRRVRGRYRLSMVLQNGLHEREPGPVRGASVCRVSIRVHACGWACEALCARHERPRDAGPAGGPLAVWPAGACAHGYAVADSRSRSAKEEVAWLRTTR